MWCSNSQPWVQEFRGLLTEPAWWPLSSLSYHCEFLDSFFTHCVMICCCHYSFWCLNYFQFGQWLPPLGCLLDLFNVSPSVFKCILAVWHKLFQEHIPSLPQICIFPRSLVSSSGKWYLEQGLDTEGTHCCWASRAFCWTELGNACF